MPEFEQDRHTEDSHGHNHEKLPQSGELEQRTARDVKELQFILKNFQADELACIPVVPEGTRLEHGATYIDLSESPVIEIIASGRTLAEAGHCYVPKAKVAYLLWNRLLETGRASSEGSEQSGYASQSYDQERINSDGHKVRSEEAGSDEQSLHGSGGMQKSSPSPNSHLITAGWYVAGGFAAGLAYRLIARR